MSDQTLRFSDVSVKKDGTYVVSIAGNRSHVTEGYDPGLFAEISAYLEGGGSSKPYDEDVVVEADPLLLARLWADEQLVITDALVSQYRDDLDLGESPAISKEQYTELLLWRKALRSWPAVVGYPANTTRPTQPEWLANRS